MLEGVGHVGMDPRLLVKTGNCYLVRGGVFEPVRMTARSGASWGDGGAFVAWVCRV